MGINIHNTLVAAAVLHGANILLKRRHDDEEPYPGWWSLPTSKVPGIFSSDFATVSKHATELIPEAFRSAVISDCLLCGVRSRAGKVLSIQVVVFRLREDDCSIYNCTNSRFVPLSTVFSDVAVVDSVLSVFGASVKRRLFASEISPYYLEFPPELSHLDLHNVRLIDGQYLWKLAYQNYNLYINGLAGGIGWIAKKVVLNGRLINLCLRHVPAGGRVLDYGGGAGTLDKELSTDYYSVSVYDPLLHTTLLKEQENEKFDASICSLVVPWIPDIDLAFSEIAAILRGGGIVLIAVPNPVTFRTGYWSSISQGDYLINRLPPEAGSLVMIGHTVGPLKLYPRSISEICRALTDAGFVIIEIDDKPTTTVESAKMSELGHPYPNQYCKLSPFVILVARAWSNNVSTLPTQVYNNDQRKKDIDLLKKTKLQPMVLDKDD